MEKIKNLMAKMSDEVKELVKKFPLTMFIIGLVTLVLMVTVDMSFSRNTNDILEKFYVFSAIWTIGTIFTETFFVEKSKRIAGYGVTGGISLIFVQILTSGMTKSTGEISTITRFLATYVTILILLSIYKSIKNAELKFEEYLLKLFRDLFNMTITYFILNIGIMMLTAIFVQLILDGKWRKCDGTLDDFIGWLILCAIYDL